MTDSNPTQPSTSQVNRPTQRSKTRRAPRKSTANKDKAEATIMDGAAPVSLDKLFGGFEPDARGNISVELEPRTPERYSVYLQPYIENYSQLNFIYPGNPNPVATVYHILAAGLNLAMAIKLLNATPKSQTSELQELIQFTDSLVDVPSSFNHVLNLIGKTDYLDSSIRIRDNPALIKCLFTKAIWHLVDTPPADHEPIFSDPDITPGLNRLRGKRDDILVNTAFSDLATVNLIRRKGREAFERNLKISHEVTNAAGERHWYSPPWLASDSTLDVILEWITHVDPTTPGYNDLILMSIMSNFNPAWIRHLRRPLNELNPVFIGTPLADHTPDDLLALAGLTHYSDYFGNHFKEIASTAVSLYNAQIPVLVKIFKMTTMSKSSFGNAAQLVTVPSVDFKNYIGIDLINDVSNMTVIRPGSTTLKCNRKLSTPSTVLAAACFSVTKSVEFDDTNTGHTTISLTEILNRFISEDARVKNRFMD